MAENQQKVHSDYFADLQAYLGRSPSPYHASSNLARYLNAVGFERLDETENWNIKPGGKYYVVRNDTSLIALRSGSDASFSKGLRIVGAHLDSPCLRVNPDPHFIAYGYEQINVEVYGSVLLRTWFDRDLSVAGRVFFRDEHGKTHRSLLDFERPLVYIPSIAIHLDREANSQQNIERQKHINPILANADGPLKGGIVQLVSNHLQKGRSDSQVHSILGFDLSLYDVNPPQIIGAAQEFIASARIDNLVSCYAGFRALVEAQTDHCCLLVCNDHEEVGSVSDSGAQGGFLAAVLGRLGASEPSVIRKSALVSADGAHGIHPNFPEKHDMQHSPILNRGVVLKVNSNQRYATTGEMVSVIRNISEDLEIPLQVFVSRNNIPCGTTMGPIVASEIGIKTVDLGVPQFAMHSIREIAGLNDTLYLKRLLSGFYESDQVSLVN